MSDTENASSAEAFRQFRKRQKAELLTLPSGLKMLVYRPEPEFWARNRGLMPSTLAARLQQSDTLGELSKEEIIDYSRWMTSLLAESVIEPGISLTPTPNQLAPKDIDDKDLDAILLYVVGEASADGRSLTTFRGERSADDSAGTDGEGVERPPQSVS